MYCRYCVHKYHSYITFTDGTQIFKKFIFREGTQQTYNRCSGGTIIAAWDHNVFFMVHVFPKLNQYFLIIVLSVWVMYCMILCTRISHLYNLHRWNTNLQENLQRRNPAKLQSYFPSSGGTSSSGIV